MSCWVVPAIAAEFWGVPLDVVWDRISGDLVPHKMEDGFVFIDVDPWGPNIEGEATPPPPTYVLSDDVSAGEAPLSRDELQTFAISLDPAESRMLMHDLPGLRGTSIYSEQIKLVSGTALDENDEPARDSFSDLDTSAFELSDAEVAELQPSELEQLREERGSATAVALRNSEADDDDESFSEEEAYDEEESAELPELDEEESATFTRLSWQDVRRNVGRTRRPPPRSS
jgi:hypothetical protein